MAVGRRAESHPQLAQPPMVASRGGGGGSGKACEAATDFGSGVGVFAGDASMRRAWSRLSVCFGRDRENTEAKVRNAEFSLDVHFNFCLCENSLCLCENM